MTVSRKKRGDKVGSYGGEEREIAAKRKRKNRLLAGLWRLWDGFAGFIWRKRCNIIGKRRDVHGIPKPSQISLVATGSRSCNDRSKIKEVESESKLSKQDSKSKRERTQDKSGSSNDRSKIKEVESESKLSKQDSKSKRERTQDKSGSSNDRSEIKEVESESKLSKQDSKSKRERTQDKSGSSNDRSEIKEVESESKLSKQDSKSKRERTQDKSGPSNDRSEIKEVESESKLSKQDSKSKRERTQDKSGSSNDRSKIKEVESESKLSKQDSKSKRERTQDKSGSSINRSNKKDAENVSKKSKQDRKRKRNWRQDKGRSGKRLRKDRKSLKRKRSENDCCLIKRSKANEHSGSDKRKTKDNYDGANKRSKTEEHREFKKATVPLNLASFTFHRELGKGSFGAVMLATDVICRERVAVKIVKKRHFIKQGHNFVERQILEFSHESHFLIHGYAAFHTMSNMYYVMELASRGDLQHFITRNLPLDINVTRFIAAEVACGVQFLHSKGIIHRDLKPANILLTTEGHIKITDFGLALTNVFGLTRANKARTPGFGAPELIRREALGAGVDWFAFGVILYIMVTGNLPFPGRTIKEDEELVLNHQPHYPHFLASDTLDIIQRLLCKVQFQRLGVIGNIQEHPFFSTIDWEDIKAGRMAAPIILKTGSVDVSVSENISEPYIEDIQVPINAENQRLFDDFSFVCPAWSENYHTMSIQPDTLPAKLDLSKCIIS